MIFKPKLIRYNVNTLVALSNNATDEFTRNKIRMAMVDRILAYNYQMFFLINKFMNAEMLLKEAYADVILMNMKGNDYYIDDTLVDEILRYASLDALMCYGADSALYEFNIKCKDEFYRRGREFEDKLELKRKKILD